MNSTPPSRHGNDVVLPPSVPARMRAAWDAATDDGDRARLLLEISNEVEQASWWQAADLTRAALEFARQAQDAPTAVEAMLLLAFQLTAANRPTEAFRVVSEAMPLAYALHDELPDLYQNALSTRATVRAAAGDEAGARRDFEAILATQDGGGGPATLIVASVNLAWLYADMYRPQAALHQLEVAEEVLHDIRRGAYDRSGYEVTPQRQAYFHQSILVLRSLATVLRAEQLVAKGQDGDVPTLDAEARALCDQVTATATANDTFPRMIVATVLARVELVAAHHEAAARHADEAVELTRTIGHTIYPHGWAAYARVHEARGDEERALEGWGEVLAIARSSGRHRQIQEALDALARLHEQRGDLATALQLTRASLESAQHVNRDLAEMHDIGGTEPWEMPGDDQLSWRDRLQIAEQQAQRDHLTGLLNRRGVQEHLPALDSDRRASGDCQLVAFLDVDHFKVVNDRFSHAVGDMVLRRLASMCTAWLPADALVGRYGGEEFVLITNVDDVAAGAAQLEGLRASIADADWGDLLGDRRLTVSIGYTVRGDLPFSDALAAADASLYAAKQGGRNRLHPPPPDPTG